MTLDDEQGLDDAARKALDAIAAGRLAWTPASDLSRAGIASETLLALEAAGWLERWELPDGETAWTLSTLAAWRLDLVVLEEGNDERPRFGHPGDERPYVRVWRETGHSGLALPELVIDKAPGPEYLIDPADDEPLVLFGQKVRIDPRLDKQLFERLKRRAKREKAAKAKRKGKAKAKP